MKSMMQKVKYFMPSPHVFYRYISIYFFLFLPKLFCVYTLRHFFTFLKIILHSLFFSLLFLLTMTYPCIFPCNTCAHLTFLSSRIVFCCRDASQFFLCSLQVDISFTSRFVILKTFTNTVLVNILVKIFLQFWMSKSGFINSWKLDC